MADPRVTCTQQEWGMPPEFSYPTPPPEASVNAGLKRVELGYASNKVGHHSKRLARCPHGEWLAWSYLNGVLIALVVGLALYLLSRWV